MYTVQNVAAQGRCILLVMHTDRSETDNYKKPSAQEINLKHLAQPLPFIQKPKTKTDSWEKDVGEARRF